jgi:U4/U6 small nuclear ribonucleoprotein PRP3
MLIVINYCSFSFPQALAGADQIKQKRAEIAAMMARMKNQSLGLTGSAAAASAHKMTAAATKNIPTPMIQPSKGSTPSDSPAPAGVTDDIARRVAEAKRRVAEAQTKLATKDNPYMVSRFKSCLYIASP